MQQVSVTHTRQLNSDYIPSTPFHYLCSDPRNQITCCSHDGKQMDNWVFTFVNQLVPGVEVNKIDAAGKLEQVE